MIEPLTTAVDVGRKPAHASGIALRLYRFANTGLFYLTQPLTATAAIVAPILIEHSTAAENWKLMLANSLIVFALAYAALGIVKARARAVLVTRGMFDVEEDRPVV